MNPSSQSSLLQVPDEIPVGPPLLLGAAASSAPRTAGSLVHANQAIRGWRVVGRAGLKADRCIRIKVTRDALDRSRDTTLLLLHR